MRTTQFFYYIMLCFFSTIICEVYEFYPVFFPVTEITYSTLAVLLSTTTSAQTVPAFKNRVELLVAK